MKNKEKPEIVIPRGYSVDEMLDLDGDLWDEKPIGVEEVKIHFERLTEKRGVWQTHAAAQAARRCCPCQSRKGDGAMETGMVGRRCAGIGDYGQAVQRCQPGIPVACVDGEGVFGQPLADL